MPSYSIANVKITEGELNQFYVSAKMAYEKFDWSDLDIIFSIMLCDRKYFPKVVLAKKITPEAYIAQWVRQYWKAASNLPSIRFAKPKGSCSDPAIKLLVKETQNMTEDEAETSELSHNLFMSAENIQGCLLEEYIA